MKKTDIEPKKIEELFNYMKFLPFLIDYARINPNNGIRARKVGKGTNNNDKNKNFTDTDLKDIKRGWNKFIHDFQPVIDKIDCN